MFSKIDEIQNIFEIITNYNINRNPHSRDFKGRGFESQKKVLTIFFK
jgi:hypothetical protein